MITAGLGLLSCLSEGPRIVDVDRKRVLLKCVLYRFELKGDSRKSRFVVCGCEANQQFGRLGEGIFTDSCHLVCSSVRGALCSVTDAQQSAVGISRDPFVLRCVEGRLCRIGCSARVEHRDLRVLGEKNLVGTRLIIATVRQLADFSEIIAHGQVVAG